MFSLREHAWTSTLAKLKQMYFSLFSWLSTTRNPGHNTRNKCEKSAEGTEKADGQGTSGQGTTWQWVPTFLVCPMNPNRVLKTLVTWKCPWTQMRKACSHQPKKKEQIDCVYTVTSLLQPNTAEKNADLSPAHKQKLSGEPRLTLYHRWAIELLPSPPVWVMVERKSRGAWTSPQNDTSEACCRTVPDEPVL